MINQELKITLLHHPNIQKFRLNSQQEVDKAFCLLLIKLFQKKKSSMYLKQKKDVYLYIVFREVHLVIWRSMIVTQILIIETCKIL